MWGKRKTLHFQFESLAAVALVQICRHHTVSHKRYGKNRKEVERERKRHIKILCAPSLSACQSQKRKWINKALSAVLMCGAYLTSYGNNFGAFSMFWSQWKRKWFHQNSFPHSSQNFSHNQFWRSVLSIKAFFFYLIGLGKKKKIVWDWKSKTLKVSMRLSLRSTCS